METSERECNCEWGSEVWTNTYEYQYISCMRCGKIKEFYWKSLWKRLLSLINRTI